jgi:hypothetical protein
MSPKKVGQLGKGLGLALGGGPSVAPWVDYTLSLIFHRHMYQVIKRHHF